MKIPVVVQHRHAHLSETDRRILFGDLKLNHFKDTNLKDQTVYQETIQLVGPNGKFECVRIIGPDRQQTQIELSASDAFALGIQAALRVSGDLSRVGTCQISSQDGKQSVKAPVIIPVRHIHCPPQIAEILGIKHHDIVRVSMDQAGLIGDVIVRVHPTFSLELHLTKDEAAEYWIHSGDVVELI